MADLENIVKMWCLGCDDCKEIGDMRWSYGLLLCRRCWHDLGVEPSDRSPCLDPIVDVPAQIGSTECPSCGRSWGCFLASDHYPIHVTRRGTSSVGRGLCPAGGLPVYVAGIRPQNQE